MINAKRNLVHDNLYAHLNMGFAFKAKPEAVSVHDNLYALLILK